MSDSDLDNDDVEGAAERLLAFMHLCEDEDKGHRLYVPLSAMDGAVPMALCNARSSASPELMVPINDGRPALWPIDVRMVQDANMNMGPPTERWPEGTLQFSRVRSIQTKDARKFGASIFSPLMIMDEMSFAKPDGTAMSACGPMAMVNGKWVNAAPKSIEGGPRGHAIPVALGAALAFRYEWSVWIGHNSGPRIRFLTDPLGAREVFRLRDLPPGRDRRSALRHWVSAHARRRNSDMDSESLTWIRRHMRGTTDFTWNGLRCRIQPDEYELERLAAERREKNV